MTNDIVTVVTPAYNAERTLDATLRSARAQTYPAIEFIVVDDGSTDGTADIVRRHMREDSRVRLLQQHVRGGDVPRNLGIAAARNLGISAAKGDLVAPLDADDLWHPSKIERQVQAMRAGGARVGLVYTWFASIDRHGRVRSVGHRPTDSGEVLRICCRRNLVGNGSGALMRKSAILECGGYDETLRERHAQGCEDLKLYTAIAERYHYAVVPEHLTGYRQTDQNLSSDVLQMRRSVDIVLAELEQRHPQFQAELRDMRRRLYYWLFERGVLVRRFGPTFLLAQALWQLDRWLALRSIARIPKVLLMSFLSRTGLRVVRGFLSKRAGFSAPHFLADRTP